MRKRRKTPEPEAWSPPRVVEIRQGSPCADEIRPGDLLLGINGKRPLDILDCMEASEESRISLRLLRDGAQITRRIRKHSGLPLGLVFDEPVFDGVRACRNHCIFCFVDQMPPGLRPSLYVKDDDYRLSFYYGNFITLNNLSRGDLERIRRMRISPLYVSLHSTHPALRDSIMGGNAGRGLTALKSLLVEGLEIHLQVVVCPGVNDGEELRRTLGDVLEDYTAASLGVVPVGLISCAHILPQKLRRHDRGSARSVLEAISEFQALAMKDHGRRIFFAADEFYQLAGEEFPAQDEYEGYPQLENGVGMARKFVEEARGEAHTLRADGRNARGIVTGVAGAGVIRMALDAGGSRGAEIIDVKNGLFGESVTVTALLGGRDIITALRRSKPASRELLIPDSMLRDGYFIDDLTPADVERETGYRMIAVEVEGESLIRALHMDEEDEV